MAEENKTIYYVAISALQKAVRRGMVDTAVTMAKVAWLQNKRNLYNRLFTILFEDCWRDKSTLATFMRSAGSPKWETVKILVTAMAAGKHSREGPPVAQMLKTPMPVWVGIWLKERGFDDLLDLMKHWEEGRYQAYDRLNFNISDHWIVETCERFRSYDREAFGAACPFFFTQSRYYEGEVIHLCEPSQLIEGWFPMEGLDAHTIPGKIAISAVFKKFPNKYPDMSTRELVFFNEGYQLRNYQTYPVNFWPTFMKVHGKEKLFDSELQNWFTKEIKPRLDEARVWVVTKSSQKEHFTEMKKLSETPESLLSDEVR